MTVCVARRFFEYVFVCAANLPRRHGDELPCIPHGASGYVIMSRAEINEIICAMLVVSVPALCSCLDTLPVPGSCVGLIAAHQMPPRLLKDCFPSDRFPCCLKTLHPKRSQN